MSPNRKHLLWTAVIIAGLVSIAAGEVLRRFPVQAEVESKGIGVNNLGHPLHAPGRKEVLGYEVVTITRFGFEPAQITRSGGHFFLAVENRSGARNLTIRVDPAHGNRVREVVEPPDQLDWVDEMKLPPGQYQISTTDQPNRVCQLIITP